MKMYRYFLAAFAAVALLSAPAFAQQSARRNNEDSRRQTQKIEKKQTKVDKVQKPANITNQPVTDQKVRQAQGGNQPPTSSGGNPSGRGNQPPTGNRPSTGGYGNQPPTGNRPPEPPAGVGGERGSRPAIPPVTNYNSSQLFERTNASNIVVYTTFRTKQEAYDYIDRLLFVKSYTVNSFGNNYNWLQSDVTFIPTPFDWTNPMTHNQFRMKFNIYRSFGEVRVSITADWRESYLSDGFIRLRFQPSEKYSTYYAWSVLEDFASSIPHTRISYR